MGQYHILTNLTKKQFVHPGGFGLGNKQREHINDLGRVIYLLTMVPYARGGGDILSHNEENLVFIGSWIGDKIAVVGDYSCDEDLPSFPNFGDVYKQCSDQYNPMYDCWGLRGKNVYPDNPWRDITADLAIEVERVLEEKIIPIDHPLLWPDGTKKPDFFVEQMKKAKSILKENQ